MIASHISMIRENNFAIYYAGDAYSTARKIMGRQSAGKPLCGEWRGPGRSPHCTA